MLTTHLAIFRTRKLTDLNRNDVALLRKMFNLARDWSLYAGDNPATRIQFFREESRDRFVQPEVLPQLFQAIAEEADPSVRAVVLTALLTGARRTEVLTMQWNDVSLTRAEWRIPHTKAGRPHLLPVPHALVATLLSLPRVEGNPYVFPGQR